MCTHDVPLVRRDVTSSVCRLRGVCVGAISPTTANSAYMLHLAVDQDRLSQLLDAGVGPVVGLRDVVVDRLGVGEDDVVLRAVGWAARLVERIRILEPQARQTFIGTALRRTSCR